MFKNVGKVIYVSKRILASFCSFSWKLITYAISHEHTNKLVRKILTLLKLRTIGLLTFPTVPPYLFIVSYTNL